MSDLTRRRFLFASSGATAGAFAVGGLLEAAEGGRSKAGFRHKRVGHRDCITYGLINEWYGSQRSWLSLNDVVVASHVERVANRLAGEWCVLVSGAQT